jgi:hypothetical protein
MYIYLYLQVNRDCLINTARRAVFSQSLLDIFGGSGCSSNLTKLGNIYIYIYMYACLLIQMCLQINIHLYILYVYMNVYIIIFGRSGCSSRLTKLGDVHIYTYIYICIYIYMLYIYIYIYIYMYIYINIYI